MGIIRDLVYSAIDSKSGSNMNNQNSYNNNGINNGPGPYNAGYASPAPYSDRRDRRRDRSRSRDRRNRPTIRSTLTDRFLGADPLVALNSGPTPMQRQQQQQMMMMQQQQQQQQMFNNNMQYQQGPPQQYNPQYNQQYGPPQGQQMYSRDMLPQNNSRDMAQPRDMPNGGFFDDGFDGNAPPPYVPDNRDQRRRSEKDRE